MLTISASVLFFISAKCGGGGAGGGPRPHASDAPISSKDFFQIFVAFSEYLTFMDKNIKGRLMQLSISARELQYQYDLRSKIN